MIATRKNKPKAKRILKIKYNKNDNEKTNKDY
jgi:hypothetical protein